MTNLPKEYIKEYTLAGNSTVTLQSGKTNTYYTYKFKRSKDDSQLYFIHLLRGPDNEDDYTYIGCYYADTRYFHICKKYQDKYEHNWPASIRAVAYFLKRINNLPSNLFVYHEGRCGACGRKLTTPESIMRGLGPECAKKA